LTYARRRPPEQPRSPPAAAAAATRAQGLAQRSGLALAPAKNAANAPRRAVKTQGGLGGPRCVAVRVLMGLRAPAGRPRQRGGVVGCMHSSDEGRFCLVVGAARHGAPMLAPPRPASLSGHGRERVRTPRVRSPPWRVLAFAVLSWAARLSSGRGRGGAWGLGSGCGVALQTLGYLVFSGVFFSHAPAGAAWTPRRSQGGGGIFSYQGPGLRAAEAACRASELATGPA
jgi:hypothetical protein